MFKKRLGAILTLALLLGQPALPAAAYDYGFSTGAGTLDEFGSATTYKETVTADPLLTNVRRNKDAALLPPPYGFFGGDIPTQASSPFHVTVNLPASGFISVGQQLPESGGETAAAAAAGAKVTVNGVSYPDYAGYFDDYYDEAYDDYLDTEPWYYADGSIGELYLPALSKRLKVYEGETLENMEKGIGHFTSTSTWDGNVGLAGHNRGAASYFEFVEDLEIGDRLRYTTRYGTRTYEVYRIRKIYEDDYSALNWTESENLLTLITCVKEEPTRRWMVRAREI